jgi:mannose-6-phosphate isomerase-like protein (cupin superfamily)
VRACAVGSAIGGLPLAAVLAIGACHGAPPRPDVPPVTVAPANSAVPILNEHTGPAAPIEGGAPAASAMPAAAPAEPPVKASFVDAPAKVEESVCETTMLAVVKGKLTAAGETLAPGDVLVLKHADAADVKGSGLFVLARAPLAPCAVRDRPAQEKTVVRATAAPKLEWAKGTMNAHLDVGTKVSPQLYLGRLEGTAAVPEHAHPGSSEVLAFVDAAGTLTVDGKDQRVGPKQIVAIPAGARHAWKPDPGSKLVAIQMYAPPGPEQRFVALAAAEKDAGAPSAPDAGKR